MSDGFDKQILAPTVPKRVNSSWIWFTEGWIHVAGITYLNITYLNMCLSTTIQYDTVLAACMYLAQVESDITNLDCGYFSLKIWMGKSMCSHWNYLTWGYLSYGISTLWKVMLTPKILEQLMKYIAVAVIKTSSFSQVNACMSPSISLTRQQQR